MLPELIVVVVLLSIAGTVFIGMTLKLIFKNKLQSRDNYSSKMSSRLSFGSIFSKSSELDASRTYYSCEPNFHIANPDDEYHAMYLEMDENYEMCKNSLSYSRVFSHSALQSFSQTNFKKQPSLGTLLHQQGSAVVTEESLGILRNISTLEIILRPELIK